MENKKYEIIKNGVDDYILRFKDQEIELHSTVGIVERMQGANKRARVKLIMDLGKQGMTIKDLTKEEKKEGKTYYDNSNKAELEKIYIEEEMANTFQEVVNEMTGYNLTTLIQRIGFNDEKEIEEFSKELGEVIIGTFPSK
jgi:hypothetical protein